MMSSSCIGRPAVSLDSVAGKSSLIDSGMTEEAFSSSSSGCGPGAEAAAADAASAAAVGLLFGMDWLPSPAMVMGWIWV